MMQLFNRQIYLVLFALLFSLKAIAYEPHPASSILMVPPEGFSFNVQTAESNAFQNKNFQPADRLKAMTEYYAMVSKLRSVGIEVYELHQDKTLPDAVFPNNWFTTHLDHQGKTIVAVYPMFTKNRQAEVKPQRLLAVLKTPSVRLGEFVDFRNSKSSALEGTGSLVLDRQSLVAYAANSDRTNIETARKFAEKFGYRLVFFNAYDVDHHPIYHTNVMMGMAEKFAVICMECITNSAERQKVEKALKQTNKKIIAITQNQVKHMCGNVLELQNPQGIRYLVMSQQAHDYFTPQQKKQILEAGSTLLPVKINTIERIGGGSARCMMAEIFKSPSVATRR